MPSLQLNLFTRRQLQTCLWLSMAIAAGFVLYQHATDNRDGFQDPLRVLVGILLVTGIVQLGLSVVFVLYRISYMLTTLDLNCMVMLCVWVGVYTLHASVFDLAFFQSCLGETVRHGPSNLTFVESSGLFVADVDYSSVEHAACRPALEGYACLHLELREGFLDSQCQYEEDPDAEPSTALTALPVMRAPTLRLQLLSRNMSVMWTAVERSHIVWARDAHTLCWALGVLTCFLFWLHITGLQVSFTHVFHQRWHSAYEFVWTGRSAACVVLLTSMAWFLPTLVVLCMYPAALVLYVSFMRIRYRWDWVFVGFRQATTVPPMLHLAAVRFWALYTLLWVVLCVLGRHALAIAGPVKLQAILTKIRDLGQSWVAFVHMVDAVYVVHIKPRVDDIAALLLRTPDAACDAYMATSGTVQGVVQAFNATLWPHVSLALMVVVEVPYAIYGWLLEWHAAMRRDLARARQGLALAHLNPPAPHDGEE